MDSKHSEEFWENFEKKEKAMTNNMKDFYCNCECSDEDYINFINEWKARKSETTENKESNDIPKKTVKTKDDFFKAHPSIKFGIFFGIASVVYGLWKANVIATGIHMGNMRTLATLARLSK